MHLSNDQENIYISCHFSSISLALVNVIKSLLQKEKVKFNHIWEYTIPFQLFIKFC